MANLAFLPYANYKDSGVEWLGQVPEHWQVKRIKDTVIKIGNGVTPKGGSEIYTDTGIPFLRSQNVYDDGLRIDNVSFISKEIHDDMKGSQLKSGDILINITGASIGRTCVVPSELGTANINQHIAFLRTKLRFNTTYISIFLKSHFAKEHIQFEQNGASKEAFNLSQIANIPLTFPPLPEQTAIANYLDQKTAQIDQEISLLSPKAELYAKLKQSLINETVTRGLNKNVRLKDSGVEWLGQMPEHWEVKRVKEVGFLVLGKMLDNEKGDNKFYKHYLKSKNIGWISVDISSVEQMYFSLNDLKSYRLKKDDILLSEGGEVGKTSFWNNELDECYIQNSVHKLTVFKQNNARYFLYQSYLLGQIKYYDSIVNQVSIKHLTKEKLSRVLLASPPPPEQKAIADYLDQKTAQIDTMVSTINRKIATLQELRKTLINDVVTGQIKVI